MCVSQPAKGSLHCHHLVETIILRTPLGHAYCFVQHAHARDAQILVIANRRHAYFILSFVMETLCCLQLTQSIHLYITYFISSSFSPHLRSLYGVVMRRIKRRWWWEWHTSWRSSFILYSFSAYLCKVGTGHFYFNDFHSENENLLFSLGYRINELLIWCSYRSGFL